MPLQKITPLLLFLLTPFLPLSAQTESDGWNIPTTTREPYSGVTVANGRIGLVSGKALFELSEVIINGVYDKRAVDDVSRVLRAPIFTNFDLSIDGERVTDETCTGWSQNLDMRNALFSTQVHFGEKARIRYEVLALRHLPYMGLVVVEIEPLRDLELEAYNHFSYGPDMPEHRSYYTEEVGVPMLVSRCKSLTRMYDIVACNTYLFEETYPWVQHRPGGSDETQLGFKQALRKGETFRFAVAAAYCTSGNFNDPLNEAERMVIYAAKQKGIDALIDAHSRAWAELWKGDIRIEGNLDDQRDVRLALYNLYSFSREGSDLSIAPMGLSSADGYNGHIFWDSEIWMYPPLMVLNRGAGESLVNYRFDRLEKARQRAENYGYRGAMFPWESDDSGEEATPVWALSGQFEQHITADIAIAAWNYYRVYRDKEWLRNVGWPLIQEGARFWTSRVTPNSDGSYSILNVVGADEYAENIDDNTFTNGSVIVALRCARKAAQAIGEKADPVWEEIADNLKFHYGENGIIKEHATYNGEKIKQGDATLLIYPLGLITDRETIEKTTRYYQERTDQGGPAMGNAISSIIYARLGNAEEAYRLFKESYVPNRRPPFGVLAESRYSDNPYFSTGAGGMLQAVLFGFGGLEITDKGIVQRKPLLPEAWQSLTISGVGPERKTYRVTRNK